MKTVNTNRDVPYLWRQRDLILSACAFDVTTNMTATINELTGKEI